MYKKINSIMWGNLFYSAFQFLILTVLVKFGTPYDVGIYMYSLAIVTPIYIFLSLQIRNILATDAKNKFSINEFIIIRLFIGLVSFAIAIFLIIFFKSQLTSIVALLMIYKSLESFFDIFFGYYLKNKTNEKMGKTLIIKSISSGLVFILTFLLFKEIEVAMVLQIIVLLAYILLKIKKEKIFDFDEIVQVKFIRIKKAIISTLPLGFSGLLISIIPQIPRYVLKSELGIIEVGYFSTISYVVVVGTLFINTINSAYYASFSEVLRNGKILKFIKLNLKQIIVFIFVWLVMVAGTWLIGEELLVFIYNIEYKDYIVELKIIVLSLVFLFVSTIFINITLYSGRYKEQFIIYLVVAIAATLFSIYFITKYGMVGASFAVLFTNATQFFVSLFYFCYILRLKLKENENEDA